MKFKLRGFNLFPRWVLSFKASRKPDPINLKIEGFKVRVSLENFITNGIEI